MQSLGEKLGLQAWEPETDGSFVLSFDGRYTLRFLPRDRDAVLVFGVVGRTPEQEDRADSVEEDDEVARLRKTVEALNAKLAQIGASAPAASPSGPEAPVVTPPVPETPPALRQIVARQPAN